MATGLLFTSGPGSLPVRPTVRGDLQDRFVEGVAHRFLDLCHCRCSFGAELVVLVEPNCPAVSGVLAASCSTLPIHLPCHTRDLAGHHSSWSSSSLELGVRPDRRITRPVSCLAHRTLSAGRMRSSPPPSPTSPPNKGTCVPLLASGGAPTPWIVYLHEKPSRTSFAPGCTRNAVYWLRRRGAKASSNVSGMSQVRLSNFALREFFAARARMSRRNFRGWPKSLTTRGSDFEGVPAIGTMAPFGS